MRIAGALFVLLSICFLGKCQNIDSLNNPLTSSNDSRTVQIYYQLLSRF